MRDALLGCLVMEKAGKLTGLYTLLVHWHVANIFLVIGRDMDFSKTTKYI